MLFMSDLLKLQSLLCNHHSVNVADLKGTQKNKNKNNVTFGSGHKWAMKPEIDILISISFHSSKIHGSL